MDHSIKVRGTIFPNSWIEFAGLTILYFEYLVTLPLEVERVWPRPKGISFVLFVINRYFPICGATILAFLIHSSSLSMETCRPILWADQFFVFSCQIVVDLLLALRVIALYSKSRLIIAFILGSAATLIPVAWWSIAGEKHGSTSIGQTTSGCVLAASAASGARIATAWFMQVIFDVAAFCLIMLHSIKNRHLGKNQPSLGSASEIQRLVYRDGAIYFIIIMIANIANILALFLLDDALRIRPSFVTSVVSTTMTSRLILNLHAVAKSNGTDIRDGLPEAGGVAFTSYIPTTVSTSEQYARDEEDGNESEPEQACS